MRHSKSIVVTSNPRDIRQKLGLSQSLFWSALGVTQSGGSRYESGRHMPLPVQTLLNLVHVEHIDIKDIKREDIDALEYLKSSDAALYATIKKAAKLEKKAR